MNISGNFKKRGVCEHVVASGELVELLEGSVVEFSRRVCGVEPFSFQVPFLLDDSRRIVFKSGRQVGKTLMCAIKALHFAVFNPRSVVLILAFSERQARILFSRVKQLIGLAEQRGFVFPIGRETLSFLEFGSNGSELHTVPAGEDGSGARGYTADVVILDEASRMRDVVFEAVQPCVAATDGRIILLSTPWGKRGFFYESYCDARFSVHECVSSDSPLITEDFLEDMRERNTRIFFRQEYLGEFVSEVDRLFGDDLLDRSAVLERMEVGPVWEEKPVYRLGVDPARLGEDESAYVVVDTSKKPMEVVWWGVESGKMTTHTAGFVKALQRKWCFSRVFVDATALGGGIVDQLDGVPYTGVNFSTAKGDMFSNLLLLLEQGKLLIPKNKSFVEQMRGMTFEYRQSGRMKVSGDARGHDDLPCALALAVFDLTRPAGVLRFASK